MLTPKEPCRLISGQDDDSRLMLTIRVGGSTDSDDTEVTVIPVISLPRPAVITLTPPTRWRMAPRKSSEETSRSIRIWRTAGIKAYSHDRSVVRRLPQITQEGAIHNRAIRPSSPNRL